LLAIGGKWATREQIPTIANSIAHFLDFPEPSGSYFEENRHLARYPALHALYAAGVGALSEDRLDNLRALLNAPVSARRHGDPDQPFVVAVHRGAPFAQSFWNKLPGKDRRYTPLSDHLEEKLGAELPHILRTDALREKNFDRLESLISAGYADATYTDDESVWAPLGTYLWRNPSIIMQLAEEAAKAGLKWPPLEAGFFNGSPDRAEKILKGLTEFLRRVRQQRGVS
jgi:hypothetical protein